MPGVTTTKSGHAGLFDYAYFTGGGYNAVSTHSLCKARKADNYLLNRLAYAYFSQVCLSHAGQVRLPPKSAGLVRRIHAPSSCS